MASDCTGQGANENGPREATAEVFLGGQSSDRAIVAASVSFGAPGIVLVHAAHPCENRFYITETLVAQACDTPRQQLKQKYKQTSVQINMILHTDVSIAAHLNGIRYAE
ncbi:unnamed protein product [Ectocarpus sp. 6 AP-2014]